MRNVSAASNAIYRSTPIGGGGDAGSAVAKSMLLSDDHSNVYALVANEVCVHWLRRVCEFVSVGFSVTAALIQNY